MHETVPNSKPVSTVLCVIYLDIQKLFFEKMIIKTWHIKWTGDKSMYRRSLTMAVMIIEKLLKKDCP